MDKRFVLVCVGFVLFVCMGIVAFTLIIFETKAPSLTSSIPTHWNLKDEIFVDFSDDSGIRSYNLQVIFDGEVISSKSELVLNKPKSITIPLSGSYVALKNGTVIQYKISVTDWSNSNFFMGNTAEIMFDVIVDTSAPILKTIAQSGRIVRGGSAVVAVQIKDIALDEAHISNGVDEFKLYKYMRDDIYIGVFAWPLKNNFFDGYVIAKDKAGNVSKRNLTMNYNMNVPYYSSNISIKEDFLHGKLNELMANIDKKYTRDFENDSERFIFFNETIRQEDESVILQSCSDLGEHESYIDENFSAFTPLHGSKLVGSFGDYRTYFVDGAPISKATHLGIDVASVKNAPIIASNKGIVLLKNHLGLYGNTVLIYHGFGVSSIYSHMEESFIETSNVVNAETQIGKTGTSGWAFGDHLHFAILVQGHFVRLNEWIDGKWVNDNIVDVLQKTKEFVRDTPST